MIYTTHYDSPLGPLYLAGDETALVGAWFEGQKYFAQTLPADHREGETAALQQVKVWLDRYFGGGEAHGRGTSSGPRGKFLSADHLAAAAGDPLWKGDHLWTAGEGGGPAAGTGDHVRTGGGGRRGA